MVLHLAHIGAGIDKVPSFHSSLGAKFQLEKIMVMQGWAWDVPPVFSFLQEQGDVEDDEMMRVFNMGIGFVLIVRPTFAKSIMSQLNKSGERATIIGRIVKGSGHVWLT